MKIIKIMDVDGIEYHLNAKYISGWFYSKGQTGITTNHGWNYTVKGNIVEKLDRAMLSETGQVFNLMETWADLSKTNFSFTGDKKNVTSGDKVL